MNDVTLGKTANQRLKERFSSALGASMILAVLAHFMVLQFFPPLSVEDWRTTEAAETPLVQLNEIALPAPPERLATPAAPVAAPDVDAAATIPLVEFSDAVRPPPPPPAVSDVVTESTGGFVVFTVAPVLLDPDRFQRELLRVYPRNLRDAGIGGRVVLLLAIDEMGRVTAASVGESSGYEGLDQAALGLSETMRFRPAMNRDRTVAVLVSVPVDFKVRR